MSVPYGEQREEFLDQFVNPPGLSRPSGHEGLSSLVYDSQGLAPSATRSSKETAAVVRHATNENLEDEQARLAMSAEAVVRQVEEDEEETADKARDGETLPDAAVEYALLSMKLQVTDVASREQGHAKIRLLASNVSAPTESPQSQAPTPSPADITPSVASEDGDYSDDKFERDMFLLGGVLVVFGGGALVLITKYCLQEITPSAR